MMRYLVSCIVIICLVQVVTGFAVSHDAVVLGKVEGRVVNTFGRPLNKAVVRLYYEGKLVKEVRVNGNAIYEFNALVEGAYRCSVVRGGSGNTKSFDREFTIHGGEAKNIDLVALTLLNDVQPFRSKVGGIVSDNFDKPIIGASITVVNPFYQQAIATAVTDKSGRYSIVVPFQGQFVIQAWVPGYVISTSPVLAVGDDVTLDFQLSDLKLK